MGNVHSDKPASKAKRAPKATETAKQSVAEGVEKAQAVEVPKPQLTVTDLHVMQKALDMASRGGVFGANDLFTIGLLVNKLQAIAPPIPPEQPQPQKAE